MVEKDKDKHKEAKTTRGRATNRCARSFNGPLGVRKGNSAAFTIRGFLSRMVVASFAVRRNTGLRVARGRGRQQEHRQRHRRRQEGSRLVKETRRAARAVRAPRRGPHGRPRQQRHRQLRAVEARTRRSSRSLGCRTFLEHRGA